MTILTRSEDRESIEAVIKSTLGADHVEMVVRGKVVKTFYTDMPYTMEDVVYCIDPIADFAESELYLTTAEKGRVRVSPHEWIRMTNPSPITHITLVPERLTWKSEERGYSHDDIDALRG